jgi:predicted nucleotidyltransferase
MIDFDKALKEIIEKLHKDFKPQAVYLFGSRAYGNPKPYSDIDLLVILNEVANRRKTQLEVRKLLSGIRFPKDILVRSEKDIASAKNDLWSIEKTAIEKGKKIL